MKKIRIQFTWLTSFYSPVISVMTGGFLKAEGLEYEWTLCEPGTSGMNAVIEGSADIAQTTLTHAFAPINKGESYACRHFAQVNGMDGFFIVGKKADPDFSWNKLEGSKVVALHGGQPMAMLRYACHRKGLDISKINFVNAGAGAKMLEAFLIDEVDYIHLQGPTSHQLEADGKGYILDREGPVVGPCAFSSLAARADWLQSPEAAAFGRAYRNTLIYLRNSSAEDIARAQWDLFRSIDLKVLTNCIKDYKELGCWSLDPAISLRGYERMLDIFQHNKLIDIRFPYDQICAPFPE
jgi:NitT/TauT family transport system substrate-binding protein